MRREHAVRDEKPYAVGWALPRAHLGRLVVAGLVLAVLGSGCATRNCPYRFVGPVLGGVHAPEIPGRGAHSTVAGCVRGSAELEGAESEPRGERELPRPGEPVAYGVVYRRGARAPDLLAQVQAGLRLNAAMRVTCLRGGTVLKTWSGHIRWDGAMPAEHVGDVQRGRIRWQDDAEISGVRVNTSSDGRGGQELTDWLDSRADTIVLRVKPLSLATGESTTGALGTQRAGTRAKAAAAGKAAAGSSATKKKTKPATARAGKGTAAKPKALGERKPGDESCGTEAGREVADAAGAGSHKGQAAGAERGKKGGVTAERGGVDGELSRITGETFGASQGAKGGEGGRDDHGARGAAALFGGLLNVPEALRPLAEVILKLEDMDPKTLVGKWVKKVASKAPYIIRRELRKEATAYAETRIRRLAPTINASKAYQRLPRVERQRFLRSMQWEIERRYFAKVEQGAREEIDRLQKKLGGKVAGKARQDAHAELSKARKLLEAAKVKPIAGRLPVNHRYAGSWVPADKLPKKYRKQGLRFTEDGYPDFAPYASQLPNGQMNVKIRLSGDYKLDRRMASEAAGFNPPEPPNGYTWHHYQDGTTMILVPYDLHSSIRHTGGRAHYRHVTGETTAYQGAQ